MKQCKVCVLIGANCEGEVAVLTQRAKEGCNIAFMDADKERGLRLKKELEEKFHVNFFFFQGDRESEEDRDLFAGAVEGIYGGVDYWICSTH